MHLPSLVRAKADGFVPKEWVWSYACLSSDQNDGFDSIGSLTGHFQRTGAADGVANNYQRFFVVGEVQNAVRPILDRFTKRIERGSECRAWQ